MVILCIYLILKDVVGVSYNLETLVEKIFRYYKVIYMKNVLLRQLVLNSFIQALSMCPAVNLLWQLNVELKILHGF